MAAFRIVTRLLLATTVLLALPACADNAQANAESDGPERAPVVAGSETFNVELALDEPSRIKGLSGREEIEERGGMLFVFPDAQRRAFVMRDCPTPIDIAFLDDAGRVLVIHEMTVEPPQRDDESDFAYESRLPMYSSRFPARFALEVHGGTLKALGLEPGDLVRFDAEGLKRRAR